MAKHKMTSLHRTIKFLDTYAVYTFHKNTTEVFLNDSKFRPISVYFKNNKPIAGFFYTYLIPAKNLKEFSAKIRKYINVVLSTKNHTASKM
jgi:hypothetical protein